MLKIFMVGASLLALCGISQGAISYWVVDPLVKVFKDTQPIVPRKTIRIECAGNEYESAQIAIRSDSPFKVIAVEFTDLLKGKEKIDKANFRYNFLAYVPIKNNTPNTPKEELVRLAPCEVPDVLLTQRSLDVPANTTQPIWLTFFVPAGTKEGTYKGKVLLKTSQGDFSLDVSLEVFPFELPAKSHLWLTNWFNPWNIGKFHNVEMWSEDFWRILRNYARNMAEHRQNVIITPVLSLTRIERRNGRLTFDFSLFDKWVEIFKEEGVIGRIEGGHLGGREGGAWEARDFVLSGYTVWENGEAKWMPEVKVSSKEADEFLSQFLPALQKHLEEKGWLKIYMQHLADEPIDINAESYKQFASYVRRYAPKLRIIEANQTTQVVGYIDIWVPILHYFHHDLAFYQSRPKREEVWFYTCLAPTEKYPNRLLDYPLVKVRILHWMNWLYKTQGFLHWGLNYWSDKPFEDLEPGGLPPGDCCIIYPGENGPLNSVRWEILREGMEDYEYLWLLENLSGSREKGEEICKRFIRDINDYEKNPRGLERARREIAEEIARLIKR
ncbi:MAG: glycoside hydrolase domain-containing protein [bacterium]